MASAELIEQEQTQAVVAFLSVATARLAEPKDLPALARALEDVSLRLVRSEYFSVYFFDLEAGALTLPVARGFSEEERAEALRTAMDRHPGRVLRGGETLHVPDVEADGGRSSQDSRRSFRVRSRLWMPVKDDARTVGAIGFASGRPRAFSDVHVMVLGFVCQFAGVVYRNLADAQTVRRQLDVVRRQEIELRRLSSPIIEVGRQVLALPLIGMMDPSRISLAGERLLAEAAARRARAVIVDLTGVEAIDAEALEQLVRLVRSLGLLGCACALSGISAGVAVQLATGRDRLRVGATYATLEQALAAMMRAG